MTKIRIAIGKNLPLRRDTLSTVLRLLTKFPSISGAGLADKSGFDPARVSSSLSWLRAMGLVDPRRMSLTTEGTIIASRDPDLATQAALAFGYSTLAGTEANVVWFETVNHCIYPNASLGLSVPKELVFSRPRVQDLVSTGRSAEQVGKEVSRVFTTLADHMGLGALGLVQNYHKGSAVPGQFAPSAHLAGAIILRSLKGDGGTHRVQGLFDPGHIARLFMLSDTQVASLLQSLQYAGILVVEHSSGLDRFYPRTLDWCELLRKAIDDETGT